MAVSIRPHTKCTSRWQIKDTQALAVRSRFPRFFYASCLCMLLFLSTNLSNETIELDVDSSPRTESPGTSTRSFELHLHIVRSLPLSAKDPPLKRSEADVETLRNTEQRNVLLVYLRDVIEGLVEDSRK